MYNLCPSLKRFPVIQCHNKVFHVVTFDASAGELTNMVTASSNWPCEARLVSLLEST